MLEDDSMAKECLTKSFPTVLLEDENSKATQGHVKRSTIGDFYVFGKLWIDLLQTGLLGNKWKIPPLIPTVNAASPPSPPQKPPNMKYTDLPLYTSPHNDYKVYKEERKITQCPDAKKRILHDKLYPRVKAYRKEIQQNYKDFLEEAGAMKRQVMSAINGKLQEKVAYMRHPDNIIQRQACVAFGTATGYFLSKKYNLVTPKLLYTGIGLLGTGALCFPEETDETVRTVGHYAANILIWMYNGYCNKSFSLRGKMPCSDELPGPLPSRTPNKCPEN